MTGVTPLANAAARRLWLARNRHAFQDPTARKPRLFVDVSVIMRHDAATGIQRVVRSVWSHLIRMDALPFDVVPVYAGRRRGYCFAPTDFLARRSKPDQIAVGVRPGDKFLGLDLAAHHLPNYVEQLSAWRANGASLHFVVYDLLPLSRPDWFEPATSHHFARWFQTIMSVADQALCISDGVAQEVRRRTIGSAAHQRLKVSRLQLSGDISDSVPSVGSSPEVRAILEQVRSRPTILMIGTIEPRKGYDRALDAFERLWATDGQSTPDLVIVGKRGWKTAALQERIRFHPEHGRRLHWLENVTDESLTQLYEASLAVFLASYDEGFGLPAVEAATHGRWVLARDLPVFREQRLSNLRYFGDDSPDVLSRELMALVRTAKAWPPPAFSLPTWSECVERLLDEMEILGRTGAATVSPLRKAS